MTYFALTAQDPSLTPALTVRLHESLIQGLRSTGALTGDQLTAEDAAKLTAWADSCDNPVGQRAALARLVANMVVVGNGAVLSPLPGAPRGFWDAV